jgi:RNA polymerase sigma-70 factor (ECF subfamily)
MQAAVVRIAVKQRDKEARTRELDFDILDPGVDPVLRVVRERYAIDFRGAFELALRALDPRDRMLLRQQFVDGLSAAELADLYRVHRATMFRRLANARRQVLNATRAELTSRFQLKSAELDSVMRAVVNNLDVTLERILGTRPSTPRRPRRDGA